MDDGAAEERAAFRQRRPQAQGPFGHRKRRVLPSGRRCPFMADISDDDDALRALLSRPRRIAMVGASDDPARPSHGVMKALLAAGHDVLPVNPTKDEVLGRSCVPDLAAAAMHWSGHEPAIEVVDVFRRPEALGGVVDEAIDAGAPLVWCQLGVSEPDAVAKAIAAGMDVIVERCMKVEQARLVG